MVLGAASGLSAAMTPLFATSARAGGTINFADIGVGDPSGDWSRYSKESGFIAALRPEAAPRTIRSRRVGRDSVLMLSLSL